MKFEQLETLCRQAANDLAGRYPPPRPPAVILPSAEATNVTTLPDFPDEPEARLSVMSRFAGEIMRARNVPAWGFVAEAFLHSDDDPMEVMLVVCGARNHHATISAALLSDDGLGDFAVSEALDFTAFGFLAPLQHAADHARAPGPLQIGVQPG